MREEQADEGWQVARIDDRTRSINQRRSPDRRVVQAEWCADAPEIRIGLRMHAAHLAEDREVIFQPDQHITDRDVTDSPVAFQTLSQIRYRRIDE